MIRPLLAPSTTYCTSIQRFSASHGQWDAHHPVPPSHQARPSNAAAALLGLAWWLGGTGWCASHWPWLALNRWMLVQYVVDGASNGLIIALTALGYTMVY